MGGDKGRIYKPRHLRQPAGAAKPFQPRELNLSRDRDQSLHKTAEWVKFRARFIELNKECYSCGERTEVVDHLEPSKGRQDVFERTGNHIPLCGRCHNTVTGKFDYKYSPGGDLTPKIQWLNTERAKNEVLKSRKFPKVKAIKYREK